MSLVRLRHRKGLKVQKNSKIKECAKTRFFELIKIISYYLNIRFFFISIINYTNSVKIILKD